MSEPYLVMKIIEEDNHYDGTIIQENDDVKEKIREMCIDTLNLFQHDDFEVTVDHLKRDFYLATTSERKEGYVVEVFYVYPNE